MDNLVRAIRFTFRRLAKNPTTSLVAVVTMALGIGLTAGMFSIIDGAVLRGLPFEASERLLHLERVNQSENQRTAEAPPHDFEEWVAQQQAFEGLAGYHDGTMNLADDGLPDRYTGAWISANFLELLRVDPIRGRGFEDADAEIGAERVVLIGYGVWQKRYGGDDDVVGKSIRVNSEPATIVGVLPQGFRFPIFHDVWLPLVSETHEVERGQGNTLEVFGRLKDGISLDRAGQEMATLAARLGQEYPETNEGMGILAKPYAEEFVGDETQLLLGVMFAAVVFVLLIACVNVTNLLLGRASTRSRELAIRSALGSGRWRVVSSVLVESGLISLVGAGLGIVLAYYAVEALQAAIMTFDNPPYWIDVRLTMRSVLFAVGVTTVAAFVAGLVPALQSSRPNLSDMLSDAGRGSTSFRMGRLSRALVVFEMALSCALMVAAALMVRSVIAAHSYDLNFEPGNILTARVGLFETEYPTETEWRAFYDDALRRVSARPEVAAAAIGTSVPTDTEIGGGFTRFERLGETYEHPRQMPLARQTAVSPGYFESLGLTVLAGRDFSLADDADGAPVAIVNEDFAKKEWPGQSPIGQRINLWKGQEAENADPGAGWVEVVGLVPDLRVAEFDNADDQQGIYLPFAQAPQRFAWIIAHTHTDPVAFAGPLRHLVLEIDPNLPLYFVRSMDQVLERTLFFNNLFALMFSVFGAVALILASIGLYGLMSFGVVQRTQEMGVRMAFGARGLDVVGLIVKQGLVKTLIGVGAGLVLGFGMGQALDSFLFQVQSTDVVSFVGIPLLLLAIAALACFVPARRAARVDPLVALRYE